MDEYRLINLKNRPIGERDHDDFLKKEFDTLKQRESVLQYKLAGYTSSCRNFMLMMLLAHSLYLVPILFFEKFCKYDHVVSVFTDRWYIGLGYISWILFMALTVFYSHKYKSIITATIENKSLIDNSNLLTNVKRLTISLIIMECWNWAGLLVPIWSVYYFINFTRPNEEYFYEFFITPEAIDKVKPIIETVIQLVFQVQRLDTRVNVATGDGKDCEIESVPVSEVKMINIFRQENLAPIFAVVQIWGFLIVYAILFIHFLFIRCIYFSVCYQNVIESLQKFYTSGYQEKTGNRELNFHNNVSIRKTEKIYYAKVADS